MKHPARVSLQPARIRDLVLFAALVALVPAVASTQTLAFDRDNYRVPVGARAIVAADVNADGWTDVAVAGTQPAAVTVLLNRGAGGGFVAGGTVWLSGGPFDMAAADLNTDGRADLVVANADNNSVEVLYTTSATATAWTAMRATISAPGGPRGVAVADLDSDGMFDLVFSAFYNNTVTVLYGISTGGFVTRGAAPFAVGSRPQGLAIGDFDRDGRADIAVANTASRAVTVLHSRSGALFTRTDAATSDMLNVIVAADLNADGWIDLAGASTSGNTYAVLSGSSSGLQARARGAAGPSPRGIAAGDYDHDGRLDLAMANRTTGMVTVLVQQSAMSFTAVDRLPSGYGARAVASADFDKDGRTDLATGNELDASATVLLNAPQPAAASAFSWRDVSVDQYVGNGVAFGDFNRNGIPDLVAGRAVVLDNNPASRRVLALPANAAIKDAAVLDYNRDGHQDVAVLFEAFNQQSNSAFDGFYLFRGDGQGNFTFVSGTGGLAYAITMEAGDMNRDGWDDLIVGSVTRNSPLQSRVSVLLNSRTGYFSGLNSTLLTGRLFAMAVGDVTADGRLDVALSLLNETSITVEIGDGRGGFSNEAETSIASVAYGLQLADMNRDGYLDYVVSDGEHVRILEGDGRGHYSDVQTFRNSSRPGGYAWTTEVFVGDFTDDGFEDVLSGSGLLLPGKGAQGFDPPQEFNFEHDGKGAPADIDGDGDLDLVLSDGYSVRVLENHRTRPNQPPVAAAGYDGTMDYAYQFEDEDFTLDGSGSTDPDLHQLTYEWRENGRVIGYGRYVSLARLDPGVHTFELTVYDERGGQATDTVTWTITNSPEIVLWVNYPHTAGDWQIVEDATAAGGRRAWNPNRNAAKLNAALAAPADYIEVSFPADPTLEYKLWIRSKAEGNSWANDSVFVQFSGARDAANAAVYGIGTTSALAVNLEECSGCGVSGWGWEDDGWGAVNKPGVTLRFPEGGIQRMRIQRREDGVSIDQIVLSAVKYRTARPGAAKNDATILEATW